MSTSSKARILSLVLASLMLGLTACGSSPAKAKPTAKPEPTKTPVVSFADTATRGPTRTKAPTWTPVPQLVTPLFTSTPKSGVAPGYVRPNLLDISSAPPGASEESGKILYTTGASAIYVSNADGSGRIKLLASGGRNPAWSPDGQSIAYKCAIDLCIVNVDGSGNTELGLPEIKGGDTVSPVWSPDGKKIGFIDSEKVTIVNADGSGRVDFASESAQGERLSWSYDGRYIAFSYRDRATDGSDVGILDTSSPAGPITEIVKQADPMCAQDQSCPGDLEPVWSPTEYTLAYEETDKNGGNICLTGLDGQPRGCLTQNAGANSQMVWSADGKQMIFLSNRSAEALPIYIMNADGTDQQPLKFIGPVYDNALGTGLKRVTQTVAITITGAPSWSRDGKKISFYADSTYIPGLYVMDRDGKNIVLVSKDPSSTYSYEQWQP